jgi:large subunit ribosomal protein L17
MIKNHHRKKLSRTPAHRRALLRNLATALFQHEKIETTLSKAKELASYSEKLITKARENDLNAKRAFNSEIGDEQVRKKMFEVLVPRYQGRNGGYTRIFKVGTRRGDSAEVAIITLLS